MRITALLATVLITQLCNLASATPTDLARSKDHPLVSRYPGTHIINYSVSDFDQISLPTAKAYYTDTGTTHPKQKIEGKITTIEYQADSKLPFLQVYRNFQSSLTHSGFNIVFQCESPDDCGPQFSSDFFARSALFRAENLMLSTQNDEAVRHAYVNGKIRKGDKDIYVSVMVAEENLANFPLYIVMDVIEVQAMQNNLVAIDTKFLSQSIENDGKAVLKGVLFDTDQAILKAESTKSLRAIADYLTKNPSVNVFIVGHTDTEGSYAHNVDLSKRRAEAVAGVLANNYKIDAKRLQAMGIGPAAPISSNASEAGRAGNRRVEMVLR